LRSTIGNVDKLVQTSKETKQIEGLDHLPDPVYEVSNTDSPNLDINKIPNSVLGEHLQPKIFDELYSFSKDFSDSMDGEDFSYLSKKWNNHRRQAPAKPTAKDEPSHFEFGSNGFQFDQSSFMFNSDPSFDKSGFFGSTKIAQHIHEKMRSGLKGFSLPSLSNFVSVHDHAIVMEKHQARQNALGDVCQPQCEVNDSTCNCNKLFDCVRDMTEYDLAVLIAGGYVDTNAGSAQYGEFRIKVDELNLYQFDVGIKVKLEQVKALVGTSSSSDSDQCDNVLKQFYSACDTTKDSCSNANQQTFQVTVDQVCNAVNTRTKLKFESIGDEYDGFVDMGGTSKYEVTFLLLTVWTCISHCHWFCSSLQPSVNL